MSMRIGAWIIVLGLAGIGAGCGGRDGSGPGRLKVGDRFALSDLLGWPSVPEACHAERFAGIERICLVDSEGYLYDPFQSADEQDTLLVLPAERQIGVWVEFYDANVPQAARVSAVGADASIRAYAAAYSVESTIGPCCPEDDEARRIPASARLGPYGTMLVTLGQAPQVPTQVAVTMSWSRLYPVGTKLEGDQQVVVQGGSNWAGTIVRYYLGKSIAPGGDAGVPH